METGKTGESSERKKRVFCWCFDRVCVCVYGEHNTTNSRQRDNGMTAERATNTHANIHEKRLRNWYKTESLAANITGLNAILHILYVYI